MVNWAETIAEMANVETIDIPYTEEEKRLILEMADRAVEILEEEKNG